MDGFKQAQQEYEWHLMFPYDTYTFIEDKEEKWQEYHNEYSDDEYERYRDK